MHFLFNQRVLSNMQTSASACDALNLREHTHIHMCIPGENNDYLVYQRNENVGERWFVLGQIEARYISKSLAANNRFS